MRFSPLLLLPAFALAGCNSSGAADTSTGTPATPSAAVASEAGPCIADGARVGSTQDLSALCVNEQGKRVVGGAGTKSCRDGRTLTWNDRGWAYVGESFHLHAAGLAAKTPPAEVRTACEG